MPWCCVAGGVLVTATLSMRSSECDRKSKKTRGCQCSWVWDNLHVRRHKGKSWLKNPGSAVRLSAFESRPYHVLGVWSPLEMPLLCTWVSSAEKW